MAQGLALAPFGVKTITVAGTTQATATPIKAIWSPSLILVKGTAVGGAVLPPASKGLWFYVKNIGTQQLALLWLYPASGNFINQLDVNAFLRLGPQTSALFVADGSGVWHSVPTVPS